MFDKILLALLILLLPVSMLLTRYYLRNSKDPSEETLKKVDSVIAQLQQNMGKENSQSTADPAITLNTVFYASDSGVLKISGIAPKGNLQLWVGATGKEKVKPQATASATTTSSVVLGEAVTLKAISVGSDGVFAFDYPIDTKELISMELRLEQGRSKKTLVYYVESNKYEEF